MSINFGPYSREFVITVMVITMMVITVMVITVFDCRK